MALIETQFPTDISIGASGGPSFLTDVVTINSGAEQRNSIWEDGLCQYEVAHGLKSQAQLNDLLSFFRVMRGKGIGFRFKDWTDFAVSSGEGVFTTLTSTTFQLVRRYTAGSTNSDRVITKPVNGTLSIVGGGGVTVNYATGIVTVTSGTPTAWTGQFDVPCRFDTDSMRVRIENYNAYTWGQIPVIEVRV